MVVSFNLADLEEEKERESCGSLVICMEELRLEKPVEASMRFLRMAISTMDWLKMLSPPYCRAERCILNKIITHSITQTIITRISGGEARKSLLLRERTRVGEGSVDVGSECRAGYFLLNA